jgi:hypothetical protein
MRPSIICAYLLLACIGWATTRRVHAVAALIARRTRWWRAIVSVIGLSLGWGPASHGNVAGYALMAAGGAASASLATETWRRIGDAWAGHRRSRLQRSIGSHRPLQEPSGTALTDLDQAAVHRAMLAASVGHLERAGDAGDLETQQLLAAEAATTAQRLREALGVVIRERQRLTGRP